MSGRGNNSRSQRAVAIRPDPRTTAGRAFDDHLAWMRRRRLRPATIRMRELVLSRLNAWLLPLGGVLLEVDLRTLERYVDTLDGLAAESVRAYTDGLKCFYRWAHKQGLIDRDPAEDLLKPKVVRGLPHPISEADLDLALRTAQGRLRAWIVLGAYAGLRAGEIARLRREDVFDTLDRPMLRVIDGKGGRQRMVPASPFLLAELAPFTRRTSRGRLWMVDSRQPQVMVTKDVGAHLRELGIAATCHSLRHRFATTVYQASRDLRMVQDLLGHQSPDTTAIYAAWDTASSGPVVDTLPTPTPAARRATSARRRAPVPA